MAKVVRLTSKRTESELCSWCKKVPLTEEKIANKHKFCGALCKSEWQTFDTIQRNARRDRVCEICDAPFSSTIRPYKKTCSDACEEQRASKRRSKPCNGCGKQFDPKERPWRRTCSDECEAKARAAGVEKARVWNDTVSQARRTEREERLAKELQIKAAARRDRADEVLARKVRGMFMMLSSSDKQKKLIAELRGLTGSSK